MLGSFLYLQARESDMRWPGLADGCAMDGFNLLKFRGVDGLVWFGLAWSSKDQI